MKSAKRDDATNRSDKHTYFLTSPHHECFEVKKLHCCTWLFSDESEAVEFGLHITLRGDVSVLKKSNNECHTPLDITLWATWIRESDDSSVIDLRQKLQDQANATFIFNDYCHDVKSPHPKWSTYQGRELEFSEISSFTVTPVLSKCLDGCIKLTVQLPPEIASGRDYYVRICAPLKPMTLSFHQGETSKKTYVYNLNLNEMRNAPRLDAFNPDQRCIVKSAYVIHIVPSGLCPTFTDRKSFGGLRILESDPYSKYADGIKPLREVPPDSAVVSFNKNDRSKQKVSGAGVELEEGDQNTVYSFFSMFEKDIIGVRQTRKDIIMALVSAVGGVLLTLFVQWVSPKFRQKESAVPQDGRVESIAQTNQVTHCVTNDNNSSVEDLK